ncbi:MAG: SOS response-associated peptidase family protein [Chitinophagaceae bacterium]
MCYDMSFFSNISLIADYLSIKEPLTVHFDPTYHRVAQAFSEWPVVINEDGYKVKLFEWGVIADYMNTPEKIKEYRTSMANARSEKIINDNRSIWHRLRRQRCLVFSTGFFEHHDAGLKKKVPFFIRVKNEPVFCFAGIYNYSPIPDKETGEVKGTFAVVTRPANPLMAKIHNGGPNSHRMPLILSKDLAIKWLDETLPDTEIEDLLTFEFPSEQLDAWSVNTIRTKKEDNESVLEKTGFRID